MTDVLFKKTSNHNAFTHSKTEVKLALRKFIYICLSQRTNVYYVDMHIGVSNNPTPCNLRFHVLLIPITLHIPIHKLSLQRVESASIYFKLPLDNHCTLHTPSHVLLAKQLCTMAMPLIEHLDGCSISPCTDPLPFMASHCCMDQLVEYLARNYEIQPHIGFLH